MLAGWAWGERYTGKILIRISNPHLDWDWPTIEINPEE
jgi:hypothetical protein